MIIGFVMAGAVVAAAKSPEVAFQTILCVICQTIAKTRAWTPATTILLPLGGRERRTPGVNTKKSKKA